jgi:Zn-dependent protease with chaperone function
VTGLAAAIQLIVLAGCAFGVVAGLVLSAPAAILVRRLEAWAPASRHKALMVIAVAPAVVACALLASALLPSVLSLIDASFDHCGRHDDGHAHLCLIHLPSAAASGIGWLLASVPIAWIAAGCIDDISAVVRGRRLVRTMAAAGRTGTDRRYLELPLERPLCITIGLFRPQIVVSTGFLRSTDDAFVAAALAHEEGHARRRDALVRLVARAVALFYLPPVRRRLLAALEVAAEQACDEQAANNPEERLRVAEAILQVERLLSTEPAVNQPLLGVSFAREAVAQRVESLLAPPTVSRSSARLVLPLVALIATLLLTSDLIHHMTESLLSGMLD